VLGVISVAAAMIAVQAATGFPSQLLIASSAPLPYRWVSPPPGFAETNPAPEGTERLPCWE
jgi:hypothetical protein